MAAKEFHLDMAQRVGVMGGTFNPVHIGHLRAAEEALEMLGLDSFLFIPSACPPHKPGRTIVSFADRWEMLRIATEGHPRFLLSDIEQRLEGKSYTVVTLKNLRREIPPDSELYFLVGLDAFLEIDTWWHYRELFELARITILRRPGYPESGIGAFLHHKVSHLYSGSPDTGRYLHPSLQPVRYLRTTEIGISSTQIRVLAAQGKSVRYLVPDGVMGYIKKSLLYGAEETEISGYNAKERHVGKTIEGER